MRDIMTPPEVAKVLRCRPEYVYRILNRGELVGFKIGNSWRVTAKSLTEWIEKREHRNER